MMSQPCDAASLTIRQATSTPGRMSSPSTGPVWAAATLILCPMLPPASHCVGFPGPFAVRRMPPALPAPAALAPLRPSASGRIEVAVKIGSSVPPPGQTAAGLVDVVKIDLRHQQLGTIHRRLLHDAAAERIDDRAHADVAPSVLVADPIGGNHEHAIVECARLQRQVPDGDTIVVVAVGCVGDGHEDDLGPSERQFSRRLGIEPVVADLNAEANALELEDRQARAGREVELLVGAGAAAKLAWKIRRYVGLAVGADQSAIAIENRGRVVEIGAVALGITEDQRHLAGARSGEQRIGYRVRQLQK